MGIPRQMTHGRCLVAEGMQILTKALFGGERAADVLQGRMSQNDGRHRAVICNGALQDMATFFSIFDALCKQSVYRICVTGHALLSPNTPAVYRDLEMRWVPPSCRGILSHLLSHAQRLHERHCSHRAPCTAAKMD